eukprot:12920545-Ditylum_brightwellii.AAC.1
MRIPDKKFALLCICLLFTGLFANAYSLNKSTQTDKEQPPMRIFSKNNNNDLSPSRFNLPQLDPTMKRRIGVSSSKSQASSYGYGRY